MRGYFGIGIMNGKREVNIGTLWRSANIMGAQFIFTVGARYKKQSSDTMASWKHIPLFNYQTFDEFYNALPYNCQLIGVELDKNSVPIEKFAHPERAIYLCGAEDSGLTKEAIIKCHKLIQLPGDYCLNVSVAGSIVMYDRIIKAAKNVI